MWKITFATISLAALVASCGSSETASPTERLCADVVQSDVAFVEHTMELDAELVKLEESGYSKKALEEYVPHVPTIAPQAEVIAPWATDPRLVAVDPSLDTSIVFFAADVDSGKIDPTTGETWGDWIVGLGGLANDCERLLGPGSMDRPPIACPTGGFWSDTVQRCP